eukprot:6386413-Amphidinium_carterae.1
MQFSETLSHSGGSESRGGFAKQKLVKEERKDFSCTWQRQVYCMHYCLSRIYRLHGFSENIEKR